MTPHHHPLVRLVQARPRLLMAVLVTALSGWFMPTTLALHVVTRWLVAWNIGTIFYLLMAAVMMLRSSEHHMRMRARLQDDGQLVILGLVTLAGISSLAAIGFELTLVREAHGLLRILHASLAGVTVLASWAFIQTMFALHYAHDFYAAVGRGAAGGLLFPGEDKPDYADFLYFAVVIGTSGQTADVSFTSRPMRRVGTLHCALAYLFNTTVLALLINIGASLI
jgi:uncharacterized membrane protein